MTSNTEAARELARDKANGRFGEQNLTDPGSAVLAAAPVDEKDVRNLTINYRLTPSYAEELLRRLGSREAAENWLQYDQQVELARARTADARSTLADAKRRLTGAATHGLAARILRDHPDVGTILIVRNPRGEYPRAVAQVEGRAIDGIWGPVGEGMRPDLERFLADIDMTDPDSLAPFCLGPVEKYDGMGGEVWRVSLDLRRHGLRPTQN